jgi:hypothetical protein
MYVLLSELRLPREAPHVYYAVIPVVTDRL